MEEAKKLTDEQVKELVETVIENMDFSFDEFDGVADISLPDPRFVEYFRNRSSRIIYLQDEIDENSIYIANQILEWNVKDDARELAPEDRLPIKIYINSPGGILQTTFSICDAILLSKTPVYTINMGSAASAAALIYLCGHKRIAVPSASFLLHLGYGGTEGTYQQTKAQQKNYDVMIQTMKRIAKNQMDNIDEETFETLIDTEWYLYMSDTDPESIHNARRYNLITEEMTSLTQFSV